jgi:hypothetical protein
LKIIVAGSWGTEEDNGWLVLVYVVGGGVNIEVTCSRIAGRAKLSYK